MDREQKIIYYLFLLVHLCVSCANAEMDIVPIPPGKVRTYSMRLDAEYLPFDGEINTRGTTTGNTPWVDGDRVYLSLSNNGTRITGFATYNSRSEMWIVSIPSSTALPQHTVNECAIYYFTGDYTYNTPQISLDEHTVCYQDREATYTVDSTSIVMSASLTPLTWRLCFKGQVGQTIVVKSTSGINYYSTLNLSSNQFSASVRDYEFTVGNDGYTPFIYGVIPATSNTLTLLSDGDTYTRTIKSNLLQIGKSGYFTIPTPSRHNGWTSSADDSHDDDDPSGDSGFSADITIEDDDKGTNLDDTSGNDITAEGYEEEDPLDGTNDQDIITDSYDEEENIDNTAGTDITTDSYDDPENLDEAEDPGISFTGYDDDDCLDDATGSDVEGEGYGDDINLDQ